MNAMTDFFASTGVFGQRVSFKKKTGGKRSVNKGRKGLLSTNGAPLATGRMLRPAVPHFSWAGVPFVLSDTECSQSRCEGGRSAIADRNIKDSKKMWAIFTFWKSQRDPTHLADRSGKVPPGKRLHSSCSCPLTCKAKRITLA